MSTPAEKAEHRLTASSEVDAARPPDPELIEACLQGDEQAWRALVERYGRLVFSVARRYGLDQEAAEAIFQDVFTALIRHLPGIRRRHGLSKWLVITTQRLCWRWIDRNRRMKGVIEEGPGTEPVPAEEALQWEQQQRVREAMSRLEARCRDLLTQLYCHAAKVPYEEIARRLGIAVGSIGPTRARCLRKLLWLLEHSEGGEED